MIIIEVNAIRRSGHHAFISWLISNLNSTPYKENLCQYKYNHIVGDILWINEGEHDIQQSIDYVYQKLNEISILIISYETPTKETLENPNYSILTDRLRKDWRVSQHIQIPYIRNIYNNLSSLYNLDSFRKHFNESADQPHSMIRRYLELYKGHLVRVFNSFNGVIYDKLISDPEYANETCIKIIGRPNKYNVLDIGGTFSSYEDRVPNLDKLLNRFKENEFPSWPLDLIENDLEFTKLIKRARFDRDK